MVKPEDNWCSRMGVYNVAMTRVERSGLFGQDLIYGPGWLDRHERYNFLYASDLSMVNERPT